MGEHDCRTCPRPRCSGSITPGQARALAYALRSRRCPACNRHGGVQATGRRMVQACPDCLPVLAAQCGHCGALAEVTARFIKAGGRWHARPAELRRSG